MWTNGIIHIESSVCIFSNERNETEPKRDETVPWISNYTQINTKTRNETISFRFVSFRFASFRFYFVSFRYVTRFRFAHFMTIINIDTPTWPLPTNTNTLKINMVCVTYIQQIYFFQHSFSYFVSFSYSFSSFLIWIQIYMKTGNDQYAPFFRWLDIPLARIAIALNQLHKS
jgi:hypothetical protein